MKMWTAAGCVLVASSTLAFGQTIPKLNYRATCEATPAVGMSRQDTIAACISDEEGARDALAPVWKKATRSARSDCLAEATSAGAPSYVELLTCLQDNALAPN